MASPCAKDLIALERVARYTIKYSRMACRYLRTPLDSNIEVHGDANFAGAFLRESPQLVESYCGAVNL